MKKRLLTASLLILFTVFYIAVGTLPREISNILYLEYFFLVINTAILCWAVKEIIELRKLKQWPLFIKIFIFICAIFILWFPVWPNANFEPYFDTNFKKTRLEFLQQWNTLINTLVFLGFFLILLFFVLISKKFSFGDAIFVFFMIIYLALAFKTMNFVMLQPKLGWTSIIFVLLITIGNDSFAYFGGYLFGKHKLAPLISPKKTWEGAIIGVVMTTIVTLAFTVLLTEFAGLQYQPFSNFFTIASQNYRYLIYFVLILFLSIVSQLGDLLFSAIKRFHQVKDFDNVLPGHGGILDRIDSISLVLLFLGFFIIIQSVV